MAVETRGNDCKKPDLLVDSMVSTELNNKKQAVFRILDAILPSSKKNDFYGTACLTFEKSSQNSSFLAMKNSFRKNFGNNNFYNI